MRTIAIFLPNWIGDVVMATPAVRAVRTHFPRARIVLVGKPYVRDVLAGAPWASDFVPFDKHAPFTALKRLRELRPEGALLFPNSFRAALLARLAGCSRVVGFARYLRDNLLTRRLYAKRDADGFAPAPVIDDYNRLASAFTDSPVIDPHAMELFTTPADERGADAVFAKLRRTPRVIGLNPGGAFGAAKHWPTSHFVESARHFARRGYGVLALCGPSEMATANAIAAAVPGAVSLAEHPLSIGLTKACVRRLALLLTTDSGPRHFAAAFGVPVVTLFGPTHTGWTETYFPAAVHLQHKLPCGPCQQRACPLGHQNCLTDLRPAEAIAAGERLLRQGATRAG